jgi:hypothetical protein
LNNEGRENRRRRHCAEDWQFEASVAPRSTGIYGPQWFTSALIPRSAINLFDSTLRLMKPFRNGRDVIRNIDTRVIPLVRDMIS